MADSGVNALAVLAPRFDPATFSALGRLDALDAANAQAGQLAAGGDLAGAQNYLLAHGYTDAAKGYTDRIDAAGKVASSGRIADAVEKGLWDRGMAESIRSGQPQTANYLANLRGSNTNYANSAEDRVKASAQDIMTKFGNAARLAKDDGEYGRILDYAKTHGMTDADEYRSPEGRAILYGKAGVAGDMAEAQQRAAQQGARGAIMSEAKAKADQFLALHPEYVGREKEVLGAAVTAVQNGDSLATGLNGEVGLAGMAGSRAAQRQQGLDTAAKRYNPDVTAQNAYAREASKSNVKLEGQFNRLSSVEEQIKQLEDMAGPVGSQGRADFEKSIGWLTSNSGKQYWSGLLPFTEFGNVPATMFNLKAKTHALQDEMAQYVQSGGAGSDVRAKNAYEVVGDLQNSPDVPTFMKRLQAIRETVQSIRKTPRVNPVPGAPQAGVGNAAPVQGARQAPDGHWYLDDPARPGKFLRVDQ